MLNKFLLSLMIIITIAGCKEPTSSNEYRNELVVYGFLTAGQTIDSITVRRTGRIDERYTPGAVAISNALVVVSGNGFIDTLHYDIFRPGHYYSVNTKNLVEPTKTYLLTVSVPGYPTITGSTTVPDLIHITNRADIPRQLSYLQGTIRIEWSKCNQYADYMGSVTSLDFLALKIDRNNSNDNNTTPDKTTFQFGYYGMDHTDIPWFAFNYYGRHTLAISAIDQNYYDFIRQAISGGIDIQDLRFNLQGGIGVFGSASVDTIQVKIVK